MEVLHAYTLEGEGGLLDSIVNNNDEIKRLATMLMRLTKLLLKKKMSPEEFSKIVEKYDNKLQSAIELRELYGKMIQEESLVNAKELESILDDKELITVRKKIGDMGDEEFRIKLAAVNWDINKINQKTDHLEKCLSLIQSLPSQIGPEDAEEISRLARDLIKDVKLDEETKNNLTNNIKMIAKLVS
jgi:hypothetical protein